MPVSSSYGFGLTGAQIVTRSMQLTGLLNPGRNPAPEVVAMGLDMLNLTLKAEQNRGNILTTIDRLTVTTTAGTASYPAAADALDIEFPGYTTRTTGGNTNVLLQMQREEYMAISDKTTQGIPTLMFVEKNAFPYTLILYPVPDTTMASFTYSRSRLLRDMDASGTTNPDLAARWLKWMVFNLAHDLALSFSLPATKADYLRKLSEAERDQAEGYDNQGGDIRFTVGHGGGWRYS